MNAKSFFVIICLVVCFCLSCEVSAEDALTEDWWDGNTLIVKGYGSSRSGSSNTRRAQILARRAAIMDGYRQLAERAKSIHITADKTIGSQIAAGDIVASKVDAVIKGATILSEEFDAQGDCIVVMSVPLYGVTDSVAKVAFKRVDKKKFPTPSKVFQSTGNYTGLIIDCGDANLTPVLMPVIRSADNRSVYSYSHLDYDKVVARGMVTYAKLNTASYIPLPRAAAQALPLSCDAKIKNALRLVTTRSTANLSRAGNNPLIIKATGMSDDNSCPVVSEEDADKILAENQVTHFLDDGAVVFTSYRVGGLRA